MPRKRTKLEVARDIVNSLKNSGEMKITHLVYKANLTNNSIKPYIKNLLEKGLIEISEKGDKKVFRVTRRGLEFLEEFNKIRILSESYGI